MRGVLCLKYRSSPPPSPHHTICFISRFALGCSLRYGHAFNPLNYWISLHRNVLYCCFDKVLLIFPLPYTPPPALLTIPLPFPFPFPFFFHPCRHLSTFLLYRTIASSKNVILKKKTSAKVLNMLTVVAVYLAG